jgi:hypothetical protein
MEVLKDAQDDYNEQQECKFDPNFQLFREERDRDSY